MANFVLCSCKIVFASDQTNQTFNITQMKIIVLVHFHFHKFTE